MIHHYYRIDKYLLSNARRLADKRVYSEHTQSINPFGLSEKVLFKSSLGSYCHIRFYHPVFTPIQLASANFGEYNDKL